MVLYILQVLIQAGRFLGRQGGAGALHSTAAFGRKGPYEPPDLPAAFGLLALCPLAIADMHETYMGLKAAT